MPIFKALKLISSNFYFTYKILLYYIICAVILGLTFQVTVMPALTPIIAKLNEFNVISNLSDFINAFIRLDSDNLAISIQGLEEGSVEFLKFVDQGGLVLLYFSILAFYIIAVYIISYKDLASCEYIENKISFKLKSSFVGLLFKNTKKSLLYSLITTVISTAFVLLFFPLMFFSSVFLFDLMGVFSLYFIVILAVTIYSLYSSCFSFCLPQVAEGKSVFKDYSKGIQNSLKHFGKVFPMTVAMVTLVYFLNIVIVFFTFGAGATLSFPLTYLILISYKIVLQYSAYNKPFYVNSREVAQINLAENPLQVKVDNDEKISDEIIEDDEHESN